MNTAKDRLGARTFFKNRVSRMKRPSFTSIYILFSISVLLLGAFFLQRWDRALAYLLSNKEEGDIVFQSLPHGPLVNAIEGITHSEWSHCGILLKRKGKWVVAESLLHVRYTPLFRWVARGREKKVAAFRLKTIELMDPEKLKSGLDVYIDRPYDYRYAPEDNEIYCSELVWNVFNEQFEIQLGHWQKLGDLDYRDHELFIRKMEGGNLPLERPMITPVGITTSKQLKAVFPASR